jgi:multimeric flavodoxin WrbA
MNKLLYVIKPPQTSEMLDKMICAAAEGCEVTVLPLSPLPDLTFKHVLIAVELDEAGYCIPIFELISGLYQLGRHALEGSSAILLLHSPNDFNSKSRAADILFQLNRLGCSFPGHPLVEALGSLDNFKTWQKVVDLSLEEICLEQCRKLVARFQEFHCHKSETPQIAALHASSHQTSNTLALWRICALGLQDCQVQELHVENGQVQDCKGCSFKTCIHYSEKNSCFYGGVVVDEIYPAIEASDAVVWLCPNYNDSVSANLSAVINRLTALYRKASFYNKALYAVVVSGNSGSDSVAKQLIGALCINKGFYLPPYFCLSTIANDPGTVLMADRIVEKAEVFAAEMRKQLKD